ncbi:MAG: flagellar biosynthetic protein FliQ [Vampirovibrionales bacterium]|jgi:flagellar biosynthetic protein FliQ|nr:flagellar biosynthetic protein FliQ [Vampirovibrionales bacterium]
MINEALFLDLLKETLWMIMIISAPLLITGLVVGTLVSLVQTVTQLQESTLTFVPKLLVSGIVLIFMAPWMLQQMLQHTQKMFALMLELAQNTGNG